MLTIQCLLYYLKATEVKTAGCGEWVADSPMGRVRVRFAERNDFGILDRTVTLPSGESVYNPLQVIPDAVAADLAALKSRCEAH